jgi:hypothetical protein
LLKFSFCVKSGSPGTPVLVFFGASLSAAVVGYGLTFARQKKAQVRLLRFWLTR